MIFTFNTNGTYQSSFAYTVTAPSFETPVEPPPFGNDRARQAIGVNQPPGGGTNFPFIRPSPDIQHLLGDFYLSYPDDYCVYTYPFQIKWLYGFGFNQVSNPIPGYVPIHDYDVIVLDASDAVVFDSTVAGIGNDSDNPNSYYTSTWQGRILVIEWTNEYEDKVCRCTKYTGWDSYSTDYQDYDNFIVPDLVDPSLTPGGNLDPRTYNRLPQRLRSLRVIPNNNASISTVLKGDISLHEGYNVEIQANASDIGLGDLDLTDLGLVATAPVIEGTRFTNHISISSEPGLGLGTKSGCEEDDPSVRRINSLVANDWQNITLDPGNDCIRSQRPVALSNICPREFEYHDEGGVLSDAEAPYGYKVLNDCTSCCDCDYFARTYQGLKRQWFGYQAIATDALEARNLHDENIERWNYQKACREENPLVTVISIQPDCRENISVTFGNTSECCLVGVHLRLTFEYYYNGAWVDYPNENPCTQGSAVMVEIESSENRDGPVPYDLIGEFPVFDAVAPYLNPGDSVRLGFKLCMPGCDDESKLKLTVYAWYENKLTPKDVVCPDPLEINVDASMELIWEAMGISLPPWPILYKKETAEKTLNPESIYCLEECYRPPGCDAEA